MSEILKDVLNALESDEPKKPRDPKEIKRANAVNFSNFLTSSEARKLDSTAWKTAISGVHPFLDQASKDQLDLLRFFQQEYQNHLDVDTQEGRDERKRKRDRLQRHIEGLEVQANYHVADPSAITTNFLSVLEVALRVALVAL